MRSIVLCFFVLVVCSVLYADSTTVSTDTLLPRRQVWVEKSLGGNAWSYYASCTDSVVKFNDVIGFRLFWRRPGGSNFLDSLVNIRPRTRGIDTLNNNRGYTVHLTIELLPR
jgi:hypothetical protein